jgi:hypothetical protein
MADVRDLHLGIGEDTPQDQRVQRRTVGGVVNCSGLIVAFTHGYS